MDELPSGLVAVDGRSLAEQAAFHIRTLIVNGTFEGGQRLPEVTLSSELGISRGPVREALQTLAAEGLVHIQPRRGAFVVEVSPEEVDHLLEYRLVLEEGAISLAVENATRDEMDSIQALLDSTANALGQQDTSPYPHGLDFHRAILVSTENPELLAAWDRLQRQLALLRSRSGHQGERARKALDEHREILMATEAGDASLAIRLLRDHLKASAENIRASLFE